MIHMLMNKISDTVPTLHGWTTLHKAHTLASLVVALRPSLIVEIGIHAGRSLIPMALACKEIGHGKVIGIDAWDAKVAAKNEVKSHADFWGGHDLSEYEKIFRAKLAELKLEDVCEIHRASSNDVEPPDQIGLLHVDGSHTDQAITDVERFASKVIKGGIVVMDDLNWSGGGVMRAVDTLTDMGFIELYRVTGKEAVTQCNDDWACFQRL